MAAVRTPVKTRANSAITNCTTSSLPSPPQNRPSPLASRPMPMVPQEAGDDEVDADDVERVVVAELVLQSDGDGGSAPATAPRISEPTGVSAPQAG